MDFVVVVDVVVVVVVVVIVSKIDIRLRNLCHRRKLDGMTKNNNK